MFFGGGFPFGFAQGGHDHDGNVSYYAEDGDEEE